MEGLKVDTPEAPPKSRVIWKEIPFGELDKFGNFVTTTTAAPTAAPTTPPPRSWPAALVVLVILWLGLSVYYLRRRTRIEEEQRLTRDVELPGIR